MGWDPQLLYYSVLRMGGSLVPILKPDDSIRICGDYKSTVNQVSKLDSYPIPKVKIS